MCQWKGQKTNLYSSWTLFHATRRGTNIRKPKTICTKTKTRYFVQKRNQTFRTKMKPDISCSLYYTTFYYNLVCCVHIPLVPYMQERSGAERSGATCQMAMPQCCYLAKGAKRPSHTTYMLTSLLDSSSIQIG